MKRRSPMDGRGKSSTPSQQSVRTPENENSHPRQRPRTENASRSERLRRRGYTPCAIVPRVNAIKIASIAAATFTSTDSFIFAPFLVVPTFISPRSHEPRACFYVMVRIAPRSWMSPHRPREHGKIINTIAAVRPKMNIRTRVSDGEFGSEVL